MFDDTVVVNSPQRFGSRCEPAFLLLFWKRCFVFGVSVWPDVSLFASKRVCVILEAASLTESKFRRIK